jgi:hypothetical protein
MTMDGTGLFRHWTRRHQIDEAAARLARRKRTLVMRSSRLGKTLHGKLTSPCALIIAGSAGYVIGDLSRPHADTACLPVRRSRPAGSLFDDASLWLKTAVVLVNWTSAMLDAPVEPRRSGEQDVPHHTPPVA